MQRLVVVVSLQYRFFGKLNWKVSALGFGTMRLPIVGNDPNNVDQEQTARMIRYAIDRGVNYIDTAFTYNDGNSELAVGKALMGRYRGKAKVATKLPVHLVTTWEEMDTYLGIQLERLNTNRIDFYLFHSLTKELWNKIKSLGMLKWAEANREKGKIGHVGFSFHDSLDVFKDIVDGYEGWDFCQIQYNYLDENYQAGKQGLRYAASKGLAVSIMEPLAGGTLAVNPPAEIQKILDSCKIKRTPVQWALHWVWNQPEVSVALSGMNSIQQVKENTQAAEESGINRLTASELELISQASTRYSKYGFIGCTSCRYCAHCPQSVAIPEILALLNELSAAKRSSPELEPQIKQKYQRMVSPQAGASNCIRCGQCEERCPQHLPVRRLLAEAASTFE